MTESSKSALGYSITLDPRCLRWKMLSLSGPKARVLLQLLIPLTTWSVANITSEVNDFCLTGSALSRRRPVGMWCYSALRMTHARSFLLWQLVGSRLLLSLSSISLLYRSQFAFLMMMLERCCIGLIVTSIFKLCF